MYMYVNLNYSKLRAVVVLLSCLPKKKQNWLTETVLSSWNFDWYQNNDSIYEEKLPVEQKIGNYIVRLPFVYMSHKNKLSSRILALWF